MTLGRFTQAELEESIERVAVLVPEGHDHAIVIDVDAEGVRFIAEFKKTIDLDGPEGVLPSQTWRARAAATHEWVGDTKFGAQLVVSW